MKICKRCRALSAKTSLMLIWWWTVTKQKIAQTFLVQFKHIAKKITNEIFFCYAPLLSHHDWINKWPKWVNQQARRFRHRNYRENNLVWWIKLNMLNYLRVVCSINQAQAFLKSGDARHRCFAGLSSWAPSFTSDVKSTTRWQAE